jgi:RimJ/RimL family protein N-acetyltransferase
MFTQGNIFSPIESIPRAVHLTPAVSQFLYFFNIMLSRLPLGQHSLAATVRTTLHVSTLVLTSSAMSNPSPEHVSNTANAISSPLRIARSDVTIRTFQDADAPRVKELFRLGMYSLVPTFYKWRLIYSPVSQAVWGASVGILGALLITKRFQGTWAVALLFVAYTGYLRYSVSKAIKVYVDSETEKNLSSVSDTYLKTGGTFLVAVDKHSGQVVGMVGGENTTKKDGDTMIIELKRMSVDTTVHSRGVGTELVKELQVYARKLGFQKMVLTCTTAQVAANRLYPQCGFTLIKQISFPLPGGKLCFYEMKL